MNVENIKQWDKNSVKYRLLKWLYLNFFFYFVNVDTIGKPKTIRRMIGGQHLDMEQLERFMSLKDGVVIDIGAERGDIAVHFVSLGYQVCAIEPEQKNVNYLWLHNWFRVMLGRLRIFRLACGEVAGMADLHISDLSFRHSLIPSEHTTAKTQRVRQVRIGDFIKQKNIQRIALLKIDAEGFDLPILKGLFSVCEVRPKIIMFEAGPDNIREMLGLVQKYGYNYFRFVCRWDEQPGLAWQKRIAIYDGWNEEVLTANSNVICLRQEFRVLHPLVNQ